MIETLLRKMRGQGLIAAEEGEALEAIMTPPRAYPEGREIIPQFSQPTESTLILSGLAGRVVTLEDGVQQITAIHVPGDFVDLHSFVLDRLDHSITALADCVVTTAPHPALEAAIGRFPRLGRALWRLTLVDAAIHRQWQVALGRRGTMARTAHLICELWMRLSDVELTEGLRFAFPLTQSETADILGVSAVHMNRTIQDLRSSGLVAWRRGVVEIKNWHDLAKLARFDPTYLQIKTRADRDLTRSGSPL